MFARVMRDKVLNPYKFQVKALIWWMSHGRVLYWREATVGAAYHKGLAARLKICQPWVHLIALGHGSYASSAVSFHGQKDFVRSWGQTSVPVLQLMLRTFHSSMLEVGESMARARRWSRARWSATAHEPAVTHPLCWICSMLCYQTFAQA